MIHRWLVHLNLFDAYFLFALSIASLQFFGEQWLLYPVWIFAVTAVFRTVADMATWPRSIAEQIQFLARCVRDRS